MENRAFEATAEELYRRPFSGRSSIVESLSRPSSVRRSVGIVHIWVLCYFVSLCVVF